MYAFKSLVATSADGLASPIFSNTIWGTDWMVTDRPEEDGENGFWASVHPAHALEYGPNMFIVEAAGHIVPHRFGFRAEEMRLVAQVDTIDHVDEPYRKAIDALNLPIVHPMQALDFVDVPPNAILTGHFGELEVDALDTPFICGATIDKLSADSFDRGRTIRIMDATINDFIAAEHGLLTKVIGRNLFMGRMNANACSITLKNSYAQDVNAVHPFYVRLEGCEIEHVRVVSASRIYIANCQIQHLEILDDEHTEIAIEESIIGGEPCASTLMS